MIPTERQCDHKTFNRTSNIQFLIRKVLSSYDCNPLYVNAYYQIDSTFNVDISAKQ